MIEIETGMTTNEIKMKKKREEMFKRLQNREKSSNDDKDRDLVNNSFKSPIVISSKLKTKSDVKRGFSRDKAEKTEKVVLVPVEEPNPKSQTKKRADSLTRAVVKEEDKRST